HLPSGLVFGRMVPGTALGVLVGDLAYTALAFRLARRGRRDDVCAMPLGVDTPSMFGLCLGVIGPAWLATGDADRTLAISTAVLAAWAAAHALGAPAAAARIDGVGLQWAVPLPTRSWLDGLAASLYYIPLAVPFALATLVGGIDNTESAAAAGDRYPTRDILLVEGAATFIAALCGGVVQNTPYIGHPAYK